MEPPGSTKKIDLRAFVADRLAEFLKSPAFAAAVQARVQEAVGEALAGQAAGGGGGSSGDVAEAVRGLLTPDALRPAVEPLAAAIVSKGVKRETQVLAEQLRGEMREIAAAGGGGSGGDGGVDAAGVKKLVREILAAEVPTRAEVEKMIRRVREGSGVRAAPVDAGSIRKMIAEAVEANRTDSEGGGGGGGPSPDALKEQMAQTAREVLAAEAGSLVRTIRKGVDELLAAREARLLESASLRQSVEGVVTAKVQAALAARGRDTGRIAAPKPEAIRETVESVVAELLPKAVAEAIPAAMAASGGGGGGGGGAVDPEMLGQMLEAKFREFQTTELPRVLGTFLDQKLPMEMFQNVVTLEDVRREVASARAAGGAAPAGTPPAFSSGKGPGDSQVLTRILGSQELKEMLDDKFRLMTTYLKTDLVPKLVKDTLAKGGK